jgi:hypothetical protein
MKKLLTVAIALTMLASFAPQAHSIGGFLSWWNSDDADNGFGLGVNHQIRIIPLIGADVRVSWLKFGGDGDFNMFPLEAAGYANLGLFYGGLGAGYYIMDSDLDSSLGWFLLGGAKLGLAGFSLFGELKYTFLTSDVDLGTQGKKEVDITGIGLNVGVTLGL